MTIASDEIGVVDEQVERLLLALEADRPGRGRRGEEDDQQRLEHQQRREDALADGRGRDTPR